MPYRLSIMIAFLLNLPLSLSAQESESSPEKKITFDEHIKPIFREHCTSCHSESDKESDLALDTFAGSLAGGSSGAVISEGNSSSSRLFALITHAERPYMPPDQDAIPKEQIDLVKTWIEQGMPENNGSKIKRSNNAAASMLSASSLGKPDGPPPMPASLLRQPLVESLRSSAISAMAASPWAPLIVVGGQSQVSCYHCETGELLGVIPFPEGEPQSLSFTRDGQQLLIGGGRHSHSGCAVLVDIKTGERIAKVGDELDIVLAADISPDKKRIALAGPQKTVRVYDTFSGELVFEMKKHTDWVFALRYSPDGVLLATGDRSNGLIVWEADSGLIYAELNAHKGEVRGLDFRADSNVLASGSLDGTVKLWDMLESKEIKSWTAHAGGVCSLSFAHNGLIASAGQDARVKIWNGNGDLQKEFQGLAEAALEVAVTGDGSFVAGGDWNGKVQLWPAADPAQGKFIAANPPSIARRAELAQAELLAVQAEFTAVDQAALDATSALNDSKTKLNAAQVASQTATQDLGEARKRSKTLADQALKQDELIQQLEAQLAAAKQERQSLAQQVAQVDSQIATLDSQASTSQAALANIETSFQQQDILSKAAIEKRDAVSARLTLAKAAADAAAADKAALDTKAAAILQRNEQTAATVKSLVEKVSVAVDQQVAQQLAVEKLTAQLQSLTDQLELLKMRANEAKAGQAQATQLLESQSAQAEALKLQLEAAEQAALDAQSQLRLFQESYGTAN